MSRFLGLVKDFIVSAGLPFRVAENREFRRMYRYLNQRVGDLSKQAVSQQVRIRYEANIKKQVDSKWNQWRPALVSDLWTHGHGHSINVCVS